MPRIPKMDRAVAKRLNQWNRFPKQTLPFRFAEWETKEHKGEVYRITKVRPPCQIPPITALKKWDIVRGDLVQIMSGPDTGKQGYVRAVARKKNLLKVESLNHKEEYVSDRGDGKPAYILTEQPIHYFDVKLVNPTTGKPTDVVYAYDEDGRKVRTCKDTGHVIPKPLFPGATWKSRAEVKPGKYDTLPDVAEERTYIPSLLHFHEEIMLDMNIPMSIPKQELERRDRIFLEIEKDLLQQQQVEESEQQAIVIEQKNEGLFAKLKFWK